MKGQWFIISAVIAVGAFLAISIVLTDFFAVDTSATARLDEDDLFWNVRSQANELVQQNPCPALDSSMREFIAFGTREAARRGAVLHVAYRIDACADDDPATPENEFVRVVPIDVLVASDKALFYTDGIDPNDIIPGVL